MRVPHILFVPRTEVLRMERVTQMKQDMHGKYTEVTDEKELIRISAYVQPFPILSRSLRFGLATSRDASSTSTTPTSGAAKSWTSIFP